MVGLLNVFQQTRNTNLIAKIHSQLLQQYIRDLKAIEHFSKFRYSQFKFHETFSLEKGSGLKV